MFRVSQRAARRYYRCKKVSIATRLPGRRCSGKKKLKSRFAVVVLFQVAALQRLQRHEKIFTYFATVKGTLAQLVQSTTLTE